MARLNRPWRRISETSLSCARALAAICVPFEILAVRPADFFLLAMVMFLLVKALNKMRAKSDTPKNTGPTQEELLQGILSELRSVRKPNE